jgi:hypothetical protein
MAIQRIVENHGVRTSVERGRGLQLEAQPPRVVLGPGFSKN